jgi:hypothetical protein
MLSSRKKGSNMRRSLLIVLAMVALAAGLFAGRPFLAPTAAKPPEAADLTRKFEEFDKAVKGAKEYDGLFKLYHKDENLYAEIQPHQLEQPFLCPVSIARGGGLGGMTLNFDEQWVLLFKHVGDKVQVIRRNVHFQAKAGTPAAHAVETTYTDSILLALHVAGINPMKQSLLINLNDIFMQDFAQLQLGSFDANRSTWHKIKAFPHNIEIEVAATYSGGGLGGNAFAGNDSVIDARGNTVVVHYGLVQLPDSGYQPRFADDRVGHFLSVVKDFSSDNTDTSFLRYVNRWRLERAEPVDPKHPNKLSAPKKKIVYWIEKSVPEEYRAYVREGILEWNKAFEKIGFRDAIEVRQQENEDFDPEDINYNTFRWITTGGGFAIGPSRANPLTGEILDADILFDADMVRYWKQEAHLLAGGTAALAEGDAPAASRIQAFREGRGLLESRLLLPRSAGPGWNEPRQADRANPGAALRARLLAIRQGMCCAACKQYEIGLGAMALHARGMLKPGEPVPEELIGQAIKETVMHEVGHTLGLRHNFKASAMLKNDQLHDTSITRKQGLVGSVMDYSPINIAPKGVKQGDYFTTTIGPYDYWAIEYAYKPLSGGTDGELEELHKIASAGAAPGHDYATDEDMFSTADPLVNAWDLGADPMKFAQDRILLAEELLKDLSEKVVEKGEGYQRARHAFDMLLLQYGDAAFLVSSFVGGEYVHRDHRGDPNGRDPFEPVKPAKQREALKFLREHILTDAPFHFPPQLLRRLAADRWLHWGNEANAFQSVQYPLHDRILGIQRIVLGQLLDGAVLGRIQNNALKADKDEQPLVVAEVFRCLTDSIWTEEKADDKAAVSSVLRRNLQREHVKDLERLVLGPRQPAGGMMLFVGLGGGGRVPPDARSLARLHLREIGKRIETALNDRQRPLDDTTRAHLEECQERISKTLGASMQVNEP